MPPEPGVLAFANTRSSKERDHIATLSEWFDWVEERPGLRAVGRQVNSEGLVTLRMVRDDLQALFRAAATQARPSSGARRRIEALADSQPRYAFHWRSGRPALYVPPDGDPVASLGHSLARAALDLLLTGPPLAVCQGSGCLKLFIPSRPDRRWCDSAVCGNRSRVRTHRLGRRQ
jgi:predicted RNA-binding Zn ribbon-like protein